MAKATVEQILSLIPQLADREEMNSVYDSMRARWNELRYNRGLEQSMRWQPGDRATWHKGGTKYYGTVTRVNAMTCGLREDNGGKWRVAFEHMTKLDEQRSDEEIIRDIADCYIKLSPENLSSDGEAPLRVVKRRRRQLTEQLRVLQSELGRTVSESEAYDLAS